MTESLIVLVPLLLLPVVLVFAFAGCVGEDAILSAKQEGEKQAEEAAAKKAADVHEAAKYENVIRAQPDLVSYWRLGEAKGSAPIAVDSAPDMPKNGTYLNTAGIRLGETGALAEFADTNDKAAEFSGTQGYVEVEYDGLLNPPLDFSAELWVRPAAAVMTAQVLLGNYEADAAEPLVRGFALSIVPGTPPLVRARLGNGQGGFTSIEASLGDGTQHDGWRHVVLTYAGASKSVKLYVDADGGVPAAELPSPSIPAPVFFTPNQSRPLRIAAGQVEDPAPASTAAQFFNGRLDEVALYRVPLSPPTIAKHYLAAITPPA